jgi:hypothetical protein
MKAARPMGAGWLFWGAMLVLGCSSDSTPDADAGTPGEGGRPLDPILDAGGEVTAPNGPASCPSGPCNYQTGTGCSANMTCAPSSADGKTPVCESAGATPFGGACTSWLDCAPGSICAGGACRKLCCGRDWTGCPEGQHCIARLIVPVNGQPVDTGAYLCVPVEGCNALDPASCAATKPGTTCQIADPTGATACLPEGTGGYGEACPCKGGFACVNKCRRLCKAVAGGGEPSCPPAEGRCVHFLRDPPDVGECTP